MSPWCSLLRRIPRGYNDEGHGIFPPELLGGDHRRCEDLRAEHARRNHSRIQAAHSKKSKTIAPEDAAGCKAFLDAEDCEMLLANMLLIPFFLAVVCMVVHARALFSMHIEAL